MTDQDQGAGKLNPERYALLLRGLRQMLRPAVYLLMKFRVPFKTLQQLIKQLYVEVATQSMQIPGTATTQARVVMLTGLTRPDVRSIMKAGIRDEPGSVSPLAPVTVLSAWAHDARYADQNGTPLSLPLRGSFPSFQAMVTELKLDVSYGALAEELIAAGCVEQDSNQVVSLLQPYYLPQSPSPSQWVSYALAVQALSNTINTNMLDRSAPHLYQRQFWTRAIEPDRYDEARMALHDLLKRQSQEVIQLLEKYDSGQAEPHHRCLGAGAYLFNEMAYAGVDEAVAEYTKP